jgi:lipopolysaccharide/colanic/teichoic acid biosynthesis glycosyltransferase
MKATPQFRMRSIGYLANQPLTEASPGLGPHLGAPLQLKEVAERDKPELIVIGQTERRKQLPVYDLLELRMTGVAVEEVTSLYEEIMRRVPVRAITPSLMLFASEFGPNPRSLAFQRAYSFVFGLIGAVVALPLMILAGVLIRLTTRGPVFLTQSRMGLNGQVFQLYEFRCAYAETGEAADGGARGESIGLTPVGRWLRRLKLDQLPQLINVLKGEMALVGPRAERPEFSRLLAERIPLYSLRHHLLPGLTGWAQLNHQQMGTFEDVIAALEYDLYYLKNVSLALDFYVIFNTLRFILRGEPDGLGLGRPQADR